jgi:hypothetical protein
VPASSKCSGLKCRSGGHQLLRKTFLAFSSTSVRRALPPHSVLSKPFTRAPVRGRSPEVSSTAFNAQPLDLHSVPLMDVGFAAICQLARTLPAAHPVLVHRLASLLRASFRPHLAVGVISPLRFAITSRPPRCEEDLHLQAVDHARHTKQSGRPDRLGPPAMSLCEMRLIPTERSLETPTRPDSAVN